MICGACQDQEYDCCLNLLWPGSCATNRPVDGNLDQPPMIGPLVIIMPDPWRPTRQCVHELNSNRRLRARCKRGHPLVGANLYIEPGSGDRSCRACRRASWARKQRRRREEGLA